MPARELLRTSVDTKKSTGPDNIPFQLLKDSRQLISTLLCNIFNQCLWDGIFPEKLKMSIVTPIFKKGEESDPQK